MINALLMLVCCNQKYPEDMMEKFSCTIGRHIHPKKGEFPQNIPTRKGFYYLADDRQCLICGAVKKISTRSCWYYGIT
jgi:rubredoxin